MRAVVQRVSSATVRVGGRDVAAIDRGLLVLVAVERNDGPDDVRYIAEKVRDLRLFDEPGEPSRPFHLSVQDVGGSVIVVSQFTLAADCRRGRRPSFDGAASPDAARGLYEDVVRSIEAGGVTVKTGEFRAMMQVALVNEGPVTLLLDSRKGF